MAKPSSRPRCWWCKIRTPLDTGYRGSSPDLEPGIGVVVCTPACPKRPAEAIVYRARPWAPIML